MRTARRITYVVAAPLAALAFALAVSSVVLIISGHNPFSAFGDMASYAVERRDGQPRNAVNIVNRAIPLYLAAVAVAIGFRMNLFNIGVEGQYRLAGLIAAYVGGAVALPAVIHLPLIIIVAMVVGAVWAGIAGVLKVRRGVSEVISTIMLNYVAFALIQWLLQNHLRVAQEGGLGARTEEIDPSGLMPSLDRFFELFGIDMPGGRNALYGFLVVAIALGIGFHVLLNRTRFGYDLRAAGLNASAARASGVNTNRMVVRAMLLSGAVAGLIGLPQLLGNTRFFDEAFPAGLGFDGIAVALLGRNRPIGMAVAALLFGFLNGTSGILQLQEIPPEVVRIMQGIILLSAVIAYEIVRRLAEAAEIKAAAERLERERDPVAPVGVAV